MPFRYNPPVSESLPPNARDKAIALETSKGEFARSAVLAVILLAVALAVNAAVHRALLKGK